MDRTKESKRIRTAILESSWPKIRIILFDGKFIAGIGEFKVQECKLRTKGKLATFCIHWILELMDKAEGLSQPHIEIQELP